MPVDVQTPKLDIAPVVSPFAAVVRTASPLKTSTCLVISDVAAVLVARVIALMIWHQINSDVGLGQDFGIWLTALLFPLAFAAFGLFDNV